MNVKLRIMRRTFELAEDSINFEITKNGGENKWNYYLGQGYLKRASYPKAAARERRWLYKENMDKSLQYFNASVESNLDTAEKRFSAVLESDPSYLVAKKGLAEVYMRQQKYDLAEKFYNEYLSSSEDIKDERYIKRKLKKIYSMERK